MKLALWPRGHHRTQDSLSTLFDRFLDSPFAALGNRLPEVFQSGLAPAVNVA
ncbi:MAG: hypothetical protein H6836_08075, partial [Planctomycetes bacterium]|nr:hypothetical protein [Planctomycetota bacterium]